MEEDRQTKNTHFSLQLLKQSETRLDVCTSCN